MTMAIALVALPCACGARTGVLGFAPGGPSDGGGDEASDGDAVDGGMPVLDSSDSSLGEGGAETSCGMPPPPEGEFSCCNGQPCRGICKGPTQECWCSAVSGGCWGDAVCCSGSCVLPGNHACMFGP